ncbi:AraC family transcriptional regulator [Hymenobacter sp. RP-2-7]|uniref:AraC family transcriptional regulator n=1 Tax=Hymenobacter polaris TaxID=2682546 RepID=A0A7Y0FLT2_9BACT|nr:helix-turn-helix domain-containing protein [Hymenobacter polaris]NML64756.1 AraC family transcriptional regulator [Hymenobacter polaris]
MQPQEFAPPAELRATIKCFWHTSLTLGEQTAGWEVMPDGYAEIIFCFGGVCSVATPGGWQPLSSPFLVGLLGQPALFRAPHQLEILGIRCFPWMVFELLGLPAGQDGVRSLAHPLAQLQAPLTQWLQAGNLPEAVAMLAQYLGQARPRGASGSLLDKAGEAMRAAQGTLPVSQVAAAAHATVRTLERRFKQSAGYTVKDVSGLMRFEQARNHLWQHPAASLAALAHELGYADQAHLSREFKRYSGLTPAAFARKARRG